MAEFPASLTYHFIPQKYPGKHTAEMPKEYVSGGGVWTMIGTLAIVAANRPNMPALEVWV